MRATLGIALLGLSWLIGMSMLVLALDDLLFQAKLDGLFLWAGAVVTATIAVEFAEEIAEWWPRKASKSVVPLPPRCLAPRAPR